MSDFVGSGWTFPIELEPSDPGASGEKQRRIKLASGNAKIEQAIKIILGTRVGERVMRPTFGSRLHELVFAPVTAETLGLAEALRHGGVALLGAHNYAVESISRA